MSRSPAQPPAAVPRRAPAFLELRRLDKSFGDVQVLRDFSLTLEEGEILALLGPSGSGKTTVLRLLAGFERPDRGSIVVAGDDVTARPPAARRFGMVFQHYALFPHMTVAENVAFGLETRGVPRGRRDSRVAEMLQLVDLPGFAARKVSAISGGQQQRVALARALAPEPRVLLLDEPLSNLDPSLRERTRRELRAAVRRVGITTVLVTHEQEEAFHVGDRVAVLHRGRLEQVGRPEELYAAPRSRFVATFVGRASTLRGTVEAVDEDGAVVRVGPAVWRAATVDGKRHGVAAGAEVDLVARPETLRLAGPGEGGLRGRVAERLFTGALSYAVVVLGDGGEIEVRLDAGDLRADGEVAVVQRDNGLGPWIFPREDG